METAENNLPEIWSLKVTTESLPFINKARKDNNNLHYRCDLYLGLFRYVTRAGDRPDITGVYTIEGTEITLEQFKKYVLKEKEPDMEKKIIGYKCPESYYGGSIPKGTIWRKLSSGYTWYVSDVDINGGKYFADMTVVNQYNRNIPAEIVETWEPVYEEEKIIIAGYEAKFFKNYVTFGCKRIAKDEVTAFRTVLLWEQWATDDKVGYIKMTIDGKEIKVTIPLLDSILKKFEDDKPSC